MDVAKQGEVAESTLSQADQHQMIDAQEAGGMDTDASTTLTTALDAMNITESAHETSSKPSDEETPSQKTNTSTAAAAPATAPSTTSTRSTSPEIAAEIVRQVEFYFSDANLPTDEFMLKQIKAGGEQGWVPLREISAFRKIKKLSRDSKYIAESLRASTELEVSEDGLKVRRLAALPNVDLDEVRLRTVIADNLPAEKPTIELVMEMFGKAGEVKMARIRKPDAPEPLLTKGLRNKISQGALTYALVEYATAKQAQQAVEMLDNSDDWRNGLRVRRILSKKPAPMVTRPAPVKQQVVSKELQVVSPVVDTEQQGGEGAGVGARESSKAANGEEESASNEDQQQPQQQQAQEEKEKVYSKRRTKPNYAAWASGSGSGSAPGSGSGGEAGVGVGEGGAPGKPRGPDGTRGFGAGRGRHPAVTPGLAPIIPPGLAH